MSGQDVKRKQWVTFAGVAVAAAVVLGMSFYFYTQYKHTQDLIKNPAFASEDLLKKVGKHIEFPVGDTPTVATVTDREKLTNQPFFNRAENGDKVIIFANAKKAILYRPSTDKIIEVGPIQIDTLQNQQVNKDQNTASSEASVNQKISSYSVAIYNGTTVNGLTRVYEEKLKPKAEIFKVSKRDNAKKRDYTKTLVITVNPQAAAAAKELTALVDGELAAMPAGESTPEADFLIIATE